MKQKGEEFDTSWARTPAAGVAREIIVNYTLGRLIDHYTKPITLGGDLFDTLKPPVIFVANHSSHLDTPSILRALPGTGVSTPPPSRRPTTSTRTASLPAW